MTTILERTIVVDDVFHFVLFLSIVLIIFSFSMKKYYWQPAFCYYTLYGIRDGL